MREKGKPKKATDWPKLYASVWKSGAEEIARVRLEHDEEWENFTLFDGNGKRVARWTEDQVPGLGEWLTLTLLPHIHAFASAKATQAKTMRSVGVSNRGGGKQREIEKYLRSTTKRT